MDKDKIIQSIKKRILDEHRKHHNLPNPKLTWKQVYQKDLETWKK